MDTNVKVWKTYFSSNLVSALTSLNVDNFSHVVCVSARCDCDQGNGRSAGPRSAPRLRHVTEPLRPSEPEPATALQQLQPYPHFYFSFLVIKKINDIR